MLLAEDGNFVQDLLLREAAGALDAAARSSLAAALPPEPLLAPLRQLDFVLRIILQNGVQGR